MRIKLSNRCKPLIMGQAQLDSNTFLPVRNLFLAWLGSYTHLFHRKKKKRTLIMSFLYLFLSWHFLLWPHQPVIVPMILDMISWPFRTTCNDIEHLFMYLWAILFPCFKGFKINEELQATQVVDWSRLAWAMGIQTQWAGPTTPLVSDERCGMIWYGMVCSVAWCGVVWCGVCDMIWCGVVWYG